MPSIIELQSTREVPTEERDAERDVEAVQLSHDVRRLFPEVGAPIDLEKHALSVLLRALNDGSPALRERVLAYYGPKRSAALALICLNQLTNPAYRAYRERLRLPEREPGVTYMQGLWRP
ncbi:MAG: hypothetical protein ACR2M1_16980 [Gemmatimonadaceae bacterium]